MTFLIRLHFIVTFGGYVLGYVHCVYVLSKLNFSKEVSKFTQSLDGTKEPQIFVSQLCWWALGALPALAADGESSASSVCKHTALLLIFLQSCETKSRTESLGLRL